MLYSIRLLERIYCLGEWAALVGCSPECNLEGSTSLDSVLSFAVPGVLVIEAMSPLPSMIKLWVATSSSLLQVVDRSLNSDYLRRFRPVISSRALGHVTYVTLHKTIVGGVQVECPFMCNDGIKLSGNKKPDNGRVAYKLTCNTCKRSRKFVVTGDYVDTEGGRDPRYEFIAGCNAVQTSFPIPKRSDGWIDRPLQDQGGRPTKRARACESPTGNFHFNADEF